MIDIPIYLLIHQKIDLPMQKGDGIVMSIMQSITDWDILTPTILLQTVTRVNLWYLWMVITQYSKRGNCVQHHSKNFFL